MAVKLPEGYWGGVNFVAGSLVLNQDGVCGMGLNVSATGTYKRVSTAPPRFIGIPLPVPRVYPWWSTCLDFLAQMNFVASMLYGIHHYVLMHSSMISMG